MVRLASVYVASPVVAVKMVQDTWLEAFPPTKSAALLVLAR
jgi:hypothetical protein